MILPMQSCSGLATSGLEDHVRSASPELRRDACHEVVQELPCVVSELVVVAPRLPSLGQSSDCAGKSNLNFFASSIVAHTYHFEA